MAQGTYSCEVTDANGCKKTVELDVVTPGQISTKIDVIKPVKGKDNGTIAATATGGTAPFTYLWNNGSTDPMITNLAPGTYTVIVTDANGCIREFTVVLEEAVGTISLDILTSINVYPNPNTGSFWVEASFSKNTSIDLSVMDLLGRRVFNQQFEGQELKTSIDLKEFNSGTFFVVISSNNGQHVEKISIVK